MYAWKFHFTPNDCKDIMESQDKISVIIVDDEPYARK